MSLARIVQIWSFGKRYPYFLSMTNCLKNSLIQSVSSIEKDSITGHFGIMKQVMHPYYIIFAIMQLNIVKASRLSVFKHAFYFKQHINALRSRHIKHFYVSITVAVTKGLEKMLSP